jgi:general secretion pathway protein A
MYTNYFGFNEKPFTLTPNPRFIFLSKNHKEAFAHLLYGINNHYGFIELTGEVGTGKTTVLRTLLGQFQDDSYYRTALIFSPCLTGIELLRSINTEFGLDSKSDYANELLAELNRFLLAETAAGRTVVLVIDEAQNLEPEVLEEIRLISNLETENDKLIQIILVGQPELETLLRRPDLRQLNQRIAVRYKLGSLNLNETRSYIKQRMEIAGDTGGVSFSSSAITCIYLCTRGVPRMINILCDRSLLIAYGDERRRISTGIVIRAMREIRKQSQGLRLALISAGIIALVIMVCLIGSAMRWLPADLLSQRPRESKSAVTASSSPVREPQPSTPEKVTANITEKLKQEILSYDQNDTHIQAFNAIAEVWGARSITLLSERLYVPNMFRRIAAKRKLRVTVFKGSLDDVIRYDLPFVMVTRITGELGDYCYAVTSAKNGSLAVSPALFDSSTISMNEISAIANGTFYLVWQNFGQIPESISKGEKRLEIKALQRLLKQAGYYHDQIDGYYSTGTVKAVREFQHSMGIADNEAMGELTLAALTRFDTTHKVPSLKVN